MPFLPPSHPRKYLRSHNGTSDSARPFLPPDQPASLSPVFRFPREPLLHRQDPSHFHSPLEPPSWSLRSPEDFPYFQIPCLQALPPAQNSLPCGHAPAP